jgi:putative sterol carrier protein
VTNPEPFMKGRFNLFNTPDGGIHISYQEDPKETDEDGTPIEEPTQHVDIPGMAVNTLKAMGEGKMNPMKAAAMLFRGGK